MVSELRAAVRKRLRMDMLRDNLSDSYQNRATAHSAAVLGRNLVSIGGQAYQATIDQAIGSRVSVVNVGRPGSAVYAARGEAGGGIVIAGGGSGGGGGGGGTFDADDVFALVDGARGMSVISGLFGIQLATNPGLEFDGGGDLKAKVGVGLSLGATGIVLGTPSNLTATTNNSVSGTTHTHDVIAASDVGTVPAVSLLQSDANGAIVLGGLTMKGDLVISGDRTITSTAGSDLIIDLGAGADLILADEGTFRSDDFADGIPIAGFSMFVNPANDRQLTINTIKSDSLHTRVFVADMVRIDMGEEYWGKSMGILYSDFTSPAANGSTATIYFEDSPLIAGQLFDNNDWILLRYINRGAGLDYGSVWGQVAGYTNLGADSEGRKRQSWTFTLRHGDTSVSIKKGNLGISFGASGQGYVHLSTLDDASGPWIRIGDWTGSDPFTAGNNHIRTQIGQLDGISDTALNPAGFGFYSDNAYLHGIVRTPNAILSDAGVVVFNASQSNYNSLDAFKFANNSMGEYGGLYGYWQDLALDTHHLVLRLLESPTENDLVIQSNASGSGIASVLLEATHSGLAAATAQISIERSATVNAGISLQASSISLTLNSPTTQFIDITGTGRPGVDVAYDLGTASRRWRTIYADQLIVSGAISGASIGGSTWSYAGSMVVDATGAVDRIVSVTNSGAGRADLDVDRNISLGGTVDGVDVSSFQSTYNTHAADPSAHHAPVTQGDGISVSGQVVAVDGSVVRTTRIVTAGGGLTGGGSLAADRTLAVGAGDGITVNADDVAVNATVVRTSRTLTAGNGLTGGGDLASDRAFAVGAGAGIVVNADDVAILLATNSGLSLASNVLAMGAPSTLTVGTGNSVTAATHTHAITAASDVSGGVSSLLKSTSGGIILDTLQAKGDVSVTNGGDFTVGANIFFVDSSLESIGVNRSPDPQFDVDIAGNLRAAYIVGKHAIQLGNALLIAHYDVREPFATNRYGELNGHMGQVGTPSGGLTFVPGKFYAALSIGGAATNTVLNPRFDVNVTDGWSSTLGTGGAVTRSTTRSYIGQASAKLVNTSGTTFIQTTDSLSIGTGVTISISCWVFVLAGTGTVSLDLWNQTTSAIQSQAFATTFGQWEKLTVTYTNPSAARNFRLRVSLSGSDTVNVSACQRVTGLPVPYIDGAMGGYSSAGKPDATGYSWSGTAHNSSSSRVDSKLTYPVTGNVSGLRGTAMMWVRVPWGNSASSKGAVRFFSVGAGGTDVLYLRKVGSDTVLRLGVAGNDSAISYNWSNWNNEWHHYAVTWDGVANQSQLYIDGVLLATGTGLGFTPDTLYIGSDSSGSAILDGTLDDFVITSDVLAAGQIRAIYESDAPVFAEASLFHFRATPTGLVWADEEGLWMRDTAGDTVLGAYGGSASSKSWGGFTLEPGDISFGRYGASDGGWFYFDRNGVSSKPFLSLGYADKTVISFDSGGSSLSGVLDIDTNGGIYQGSGSFASPTTGLKIYNSGGIGKIAGYNGGTLQWHGDTDGKLYAGGGNVKLDSTGINVLTGTTPAQANSYNFLNGGSVIAQMQSYLASTAISLVLSANPNSIASRSAYLDLEALGTNSNPGQIRLRTYSSGVQTSGLTLTNFVSGYQASFDGPVLVSQQSTTGSVAVLGLDQLDDSEEFIDFQGASGSGTTTPISTAAAGTYYGKVRVAVNGTFKWLHLFN